MVFLNVCPDHKDGYFWGGYHLCRGPCDQWKISLLGARHDFRNSDKPSGGLCFESFERKHRF